MMVMEVEGFTATLRAAVYKTSARMGFEVDEEKMQKILLYGDELQKWNKAYNLVGRKLGSEGLASLYVDAISPLCVRGLFDGRKEVLDIGSGAGLPGIALYLMVGPFPLTLVEAQRKKITFLRHVCRKLELDEIRLYPGRLEEMIKEEDHLNAYEVGLARAVMDPLRLIRVARPLLCEGGRMVVFVGKADAERIRKASLDMNEKGLRLEAIKSTQRIVGKENYLAVIEKAGH